MRIISGTYRGKKLLAADESITRPTSDRAKEGLFNILSHYLLTQGKNWKDILFADVFAGSGAIGFEALSRGADHVFFFESHHVARHYIELNARGFPENYALFINALTPPPAAQSMDIYFSDAPYGQKLTEQALKAFYDNGWINQSTLIVLETQTGENLVLSEEFEITRQCTYGRNMFSFVKIREVK